MLPLNASITLRSIYLSDFPFIWILGIFLSRLFYETSSQKNLQFTYFYSWWQLFKTVILTPTCLRSSQINDSSHFSIDFCLNPVHSVLSKICVSWHIFACFCHPWENLTSSFLAQCKAELHPCHLASSERLSWDKAATRFWSYAVRTGAPLLLSATPLSVR